MADRSRKGGWKRAGAAAVFVLFLAFILTPGRALAYGAAYTDPDTGYQVVIDDEANLLISDEEERLAEEMRPVTAYGNAAFVSVDYNAASTSSFAEDYFDRTFGRQSGTVFVVDMDNRNIYIFSRGNVYETITNSRAETITDNIYRYASNGDYYACASAAYEQILTLLEGGRIAQPMKYIRIESCN